MKSTLLIALFVLCLVGGTFAQSSSHVNESQNALMQNQTNPNVIMENGQVHGLPPSNSNSPGPQNSSHHEKNGDHTLGHYWDTTMCGLNYFISSTLVETRYNIYAHSTFGSGFPAHINTGNGLPPNAIVVKAVVWWDVSYQTNASSTSPTLTTTNPNGTPITLTALMVGHDGPKCWGDIGTRTFRVELPVDTSGNGGAVGCNGPYTFSITGNSAWEVDGITLMIMYKDPAATYNGSVYIDDGCWTAYGTPESHTVTGFNVCGTPTGSRAFSLAGDIQDDINSAVHPAYLNNTTYQFPNGFYEDDDTTVNFTAGQTTCINGYDGGQCGCDCYCWLMTGCYFQTTCTTCTTSTGSALVLTMTDSNSICNQANGTATVYATGGSGTPYHYHWSNSQTTQHVTNLAPDSTYSVTVTDASGCHSAVDSVHILTQSSVTITMSVTNVSCYGLSDGQIIADTSGGLPPFTYAWSPTGGNPLTASGLPIGQYPITVTDNIGCTRTDTITVTQPPQLFFTSVAAGELCFNTATGIVSTSATGGTPGYSYVWSPTQGNVATASNLVTGIYNITVTDANGCTEMSNATVTEPPQLSIVMSPNTTICFGTSTDLLATVGGGTTGYTYSWDNGSISSDQTVSPTTTTSYSITSTDANGCTITGGPITINVTPPLAVITMATAQICQGQSATIGAIATGGNGHYTYIWDNGIGTANGIITVNPTVTTIYTVTVTDSCTIPNVTATDTVVVNSAPTVEFYGFPVSGCNPITVKFTNLTTSPLPIIKWEWNFGDGSAHSDSMNPSHIYNTPGLFSVTLVATSSSNCVSTLTDSAYIDVYPNPVARFLINPLITTILSPEISFLDQSQGADTVTYTFGDGSSSTLRNPFHSYTDTGIYWITQYVMNQYGCTDSISGLVTITMDYEFYVPSAFTPNGNGTNDWFSGVGRNVTNYQMLIFDRWGELLFSSNDMGNGWDGTFNGSQCKQDTYIYEITFTDNTNI